MGLGAGLGAFAEGFEGGMRMRDSFDKRREERRNRDALDKINTDAQTKFDQSVAAGDTSPDKFTEFWTQYALPRRTQELLRQGDIAGAQALRKWGESDAALTGGKLFSSAMFKAQTGDAGGAIDDAIKAGQTKGYIDHNFQLMGKEKIQDKDGNLVGFRLRIKDGDGNEVMQDIAAGDVPRVVSTFANPDVAWQSQQDARAKDRERKNKLDDYETKKKIDKEYSGNDAESYRKAREARMKNDLGFADLPADKQDEAVRQDLAAADQYAAGRSTGAPVSPNAAGEAPTGLGQPGAPAQPRQRIIVDTATGQQVDPSAAVPARQEQQPSGIGAAPTPSSRPQSPDEARAASKQAIIADAADRIAKGGNPQLIAQLLRNAGISEQEWPTGMQAGRVPAPAAGPIGLGGQ